MYEHMATVRSLDVVNLPTISPYTTMSITRDDFPNQSKRQLGRYVICYSSTLVDVNFLQRLPTNRPKYRKLNFYSRSGQFKKSSQNCKTKREKKYTAIFFNVFIQIPSTYTLKGGSIHFHIGFVQVYILEVSHIITLTSPFPHYSPFVQSLMPRKVRHQDLSFDYRCLITICTRTR